MLRWRLVGAAALLVPLAILLWLDDQRHGGRPGIWISGFALLVAGLASGEINQFLRVALGSVSSLINTIAVIATIVCSMVPLILPERAGVDGLGTLRWAMLGIGVGLAFVFGYELRRFPGPGESIRRLAGGTLSVAYLGFPIACLINLRILQSPVVQNHPGRLGLLAVLSTLLVVKLSDTGAYLVGRTVGRTKLSRISPGKTWEGLMGGVLFGLLGAALTRWWILPTFGGFTNPGSISSFALYAVTITGFGLAGDLTESVLKRDCQLKDSSHLLPGLGGILDVIDSVLAVAPVSLVWWASGCLV